MANKISLEIEVVDNGRIKLKQFADEGKQALNDLAGSAKSLSNSSAGLQTQFEKLSSTVKVKKAIDELAGSSTNLAHAYANIQAHLMRLSSTVANRNVFDNFGSSVKKAEASISDLRSATSDLYTESSMLGTILRGLAALFGSYIGKWLLENIQSYIASTRQFEEELRKLQERLEKLHTPAKVLEFFREQQRLAAEQAEQLRPQIEQIERLKKTREAILESVGNRPLLLLGEVRKNIRDWSIEIEELSRKVDDASQSLMAKIRIMIEAATKYDEMTSESRELRDELDKLKQKYEELERKFKDLEKAQSLLLQEWIRAEERATQAIYDGGKALQQLEDRYESNLPIMKAFHKVGNEINQNTEQFVNLATYVTDGLSSYGDAVDGARQKQEDLNQAGQQSISIFSGLLDVFSALMGVFSAFGLRIGGAIQRIFGGLSAIQNLVNTVGRLAGGQGQATGLFGAGGILGRAWRWLTGGASGAAATAGGGAAMMGAGTLIMPPTVFGPALAPGLLTGIEGAVVAGTEAGISSARAWASGARRA